MSLYQVLSLIVFLGVFGGGAAWAFYGIHLGLKDQRHHQHKH
ncbi:MAG TPA: hypothetical protein VLO13_00060 [Halomonas sp.]|nr:hypothetical protein [Halomonas sp.]